MAPVYLPILYRKPVLVESFEIQQMMQVPVTIYSCLFYTGNC
jgi:hypothetical protein